MVGMSCRFPGAADLDEYWRNLRDGVDSIVRFDDDELRAAGVPESERHGEGYVGAGSDLMGFDEFDAEFFGYSAREAEIIDPQHRVFLQLCWAALEHAGYTPDSGSGTVGVFGGASTSAYLSNVFANLDSGAGIRDANVGMGNELGFLTTRVSYKLDLHGPSFPVQTACSSSLVAVHVARQNLLNFECDVAVAGAVSFKTPPGRGYQHQDGGITSPDGLCRPYDAAAEGTLFTNGAGVVVLKRLDDAIADGDTVYGLLRGSAVNNDGSAKASFSAPSVTGQVAVIADAIADAGLAADSIDYVEGHGSGTKIGDAIEIQALAEAYRQSTDRTQFATIGSVKSNLGHLDAAAGMAGLIKILLAMRHEQLPPTAHFVRPNPEIDFASSPFRVQGELSPWPRGHRPRRAGLSAFGFGGTNAHVVVEEPPLHEVLTDEPEVDVLDGVGRPELFVLSARTADALDAAADRLAAALSDGLPAGTTARDVAQTLAVGRRHFAHRRIVVAADLATAGRALSRRDPSTTGDSVVTGTPPRVVHGFAFGGVDALVAGAELYHAEPAFRAAVHESAAAFAPHIDVDLVEALLSARVSRDAVAAPVHFVLGHALSTWFSGLGIAPDAVLGAGPAELLAATVAGVLSLDDACRLVALLGRSADAVGPTSSVFVDRSLADLRTFLTSDVRVTRMLTGGVIVNGPDDALAALSARVRDGLGARPRPLVQQPAAETWVPASAVEQFAAALATVRIADPVIPMLSAVTGAELEPSQARAAAFWRALPAAPADLLAGVAAATSGRMMLDLSSGRAYAMAARSMRSLEQGDVVAVLPRPQGRAVDAATRALGRLWLAGAEPRWEERAAASPWRRVGLPTYPFARVRHWLKAQQPASDEPAGTPHLMARGRPTALIADDGLDHELLDAVVLDTLDQQVYETRFDIERHWVVSEHRLLDEAIVPGTAYLEMARAAASRFLGRRVTDLVDVEFFVPLLVRGDATSVVHTSVQRDSDSDAVCFTVAGARTSPDGQRKWTLHARGSARVEAAAAYPHDAPPTLAESRERCFLGTIDRDTLDGPHSVMAFGGRWTRTLQSVGLGEHLALGHMELPEDYRSELDGMDLHPALLDLATGFGSWATLTEGVDAESLRADSAFFLPLSYDRIRMYGPIPAESYSVMRTDSRAAEDSAAHTRRADVTVYAPDGTVVVDVRGFVVKRVADPHTISSRLRGDDLLHHVAWLPADAISEAVPSGRVLLLDLGGNGTPVLEALRAAGVDTTPATGGDEETLSGVLDRFAPTAADTVVVSTGGNADSVADPERARQAIERDLLGLFALARALGAAEQAPGAVLVVGELVHAVTGAEGRLAPLAAASFGLASVLEHENEGLRCRCLDLEPGLGADLLLRELAARDEPGLIAYRDGVRYRATLVAGEADEQDGNTPLLPPGSTVLVTGGLGGLGLAVANLLARTVPDAQLVLVGRRGLPGDDSGPQATRAREAVGLLRGLGATVTCHSADVADEQSVRDLLTRVEAEHGRPALVVHAAGVAGDGFIVRKEAATFRATVAPKMQGAIALDAAFQGPDGPPVVAFGSTAALFGAAGQSDYVAANGFLDAWAAWRSREGRPTVTIDWTDWTETGMAADHDVAPDQGFFASVSPRAALSAFHAVVRRLVDPTLGAGPTRVVVGAINHAALARTGRAALEHQLARAPVSLSPALARSITDTNHVPAAGADGEEDAQGDLTSVVLTGRDSERYTATEALVAAVWGLELSRSEIPVDVPLFDLGCDSLIALRIARGVQRRIGRPIKLATLFQHPTVADFAERLDDA